MFCSVLRQEDLPIHRSIKRKKTRKWRNTISSKGEPASPDAPADVRSHWLSGFSARIHSSLLRFPRALPVVLFLFIVGLTVITVIRVEAAEKARVEARADIDTEAVARALERRSEEFSSLLESSKILFSAIGTVTPARFGILISEVARDMELRGARSFGWIALEDRPWEQGGPAALITHIAPDRPYNLERIGNNLYESEVVAPVLREAARTNVPTATGMTPTISDRPGEGAGFVVVLPVYAERSTASRRQGDLTGYFFASFELKEFLAESILPLDKPNLGIRLYDELDAERNLMARAGPELIDPLVIERPITIGNRQVLLSVDTPHKSSLTQASIGILLFGLTLASLVMFVAQWIGNRAAEDQKRLAFLEEQYSIRNSLSRELNHRVKNTLASVLSILALTRRRATSLDQFADSLEGRIRALSNTHDLLSDADWGTTSMRSVIRTELAHMAEEGDTLSIEGPPLDLAPGEALSFGLAVHELATNAAKFGALSVPEGKVEISWDVACDTKSGDEVAIVEWRERGGPQVASDRRRGFGTELIERLVPAQLKQKVTLEFETEGVRCVFGVPVRRPGEFQLRQKS